MAPPRWIPALLLLFAGFLAAAGSGCAAGGAPSGGDPSPAPPGATLPDARDPRAWFHGYYLHPDPDGLLEALDRERAAGTFDGPVVDPLLAGFVAEVLRLHPARIGEWAEALPTRTVGQREFLECVLLLCGTKESGRRLQVLRSSRTIHRDPAILGLIVGVPVRNFPLLAPESLDILWGAFLASGDPEVVRRILLALPWTSSANAEMRNIGAAARSSLVAYGRRHPRVREILREESAGRSGPGVDDIHAVIEAIEGGAAVAE